MTALVLGASGFLGSHVTRQLVEDGQDVRVLLRKTSSTKAIEDLDIERHYGGLFDDDALRAAMTGYDVVYYCVVDARYWLRDRPPLFQTNVEGLRNVLDIACEFPGLRKFVFTSTIGTLAINDSPGHRRRPAQLGRWRAVHRVAGWRPRELLFSTSRDRAARVAMCVSTTFGPGDWQPTPHGLMISLVAKGKLAVVPGFSWRWSVSRDAARAMVLAAERGRVGERYIISDRYMSTRAGGRDRRRDGRRPATTLGRPGVADVPRCPFSTIWPPGCCAATFRWRWPAPGSAIRCRRWTTARPSANSAGSPSPSRPRWPVRSISSSR